MTRKRVLIALGVLAVVALIFAPAALAAAGGGSAGFSDGGGGGGGGGNGFVLFVLVDLLFRIALLGHGLGALFLIALGLLYLFVTRVRADDAGALRDRCGSRSGGRHRSSQRERRVELAAAEAAEDDPEFAPENVLADRRAAVLRDPEGVGRRGPGPSARTGGAGSAGRVGAPAGRLRPTGMAQSRRADRRADDRVRRTPPQGRQRQRPRRGEDRRAAQGLRDRQLRPASEADRPAWRDQPDARVLDARSPWRRTGC